MNFYLLLNLIFYLRQRYDVNQDFKYAVANAIITGKPTFAKSDGYNVALFLNDNNKVYFRDILSISDKFQKIRGFPQNVLIFLSGIDLLPLLAGIKAIILILLYILICLFAFVQ